MADTPNGHDAGAGVPATWDFAEFTIGGKVVRVPAFSFHMLEVLQPELKKLDNDAGDLDWIERNGILFRIIAVLCNPNGSVEEILTNIQALKQVCSISEMRELIPSYNNLLRVSGFLMGEAEAPDTGANPGTGTSEASQPSLPLGESVAETSIGFEDHTR